MTVPPEEGGEREVLSDRWGEFASQVAAAVKAGASVVISTDSVGFGARLGRTPARPDDA